MPLTPDLAVEVLSQSNRLRDVREKVADLLAAGTRLVWVVDQRRKKVSEYRVLLAPCFLEEADRLEGEDVVPGFSLPVSALFSR